MVPTSNDECDCIGTIQSAVSKFLGVERLGASSSGPATLVRVWVGGAAKLDSGRCAKL